MVKKYTKERDYQRDLIKKLKDIFPQAIIMKTDANHIQGIPDLLILNGSKWASLEVKVSENASVRPNQSSFVDTMNKMSYSSFIYPENEGRVLDELQRTLRFSR